MDIILLVLFCAVGMLCGNLLSLKKRKEIEEEFNAAQNTVSSLREKEKTSAGLISGLEAKSKEAQALYAVLDRLSSTLEKEPLMQSMCSVLLSIFDASGCKIYVSDERKNVLETFKAQGKEHFEVDAVEGNKMDISFRELSDRQALEPFIVQKDSLQRSEHTLSIPLSRKSRECGLLLLEKQDLSARFTFHEEKLLHTIGQHLVMTLENVRLYEDAIRDGLTGLYIRRYFNLRLEEETHRYSRYGAVPFAVVMMDLDHFKQLNDAHGHLLGDEVLKGVSRYLLSRFRSTDIAARFGGEEFSLILLHVEKADAVKIMEDVRAKIQSLPFYVNEDKAGEPLYVTASSGIACCPEDGLVREELLQRADDALYEAKHAGRNRVAAWNGARAETEAEKQTQAEIKAETEIQNGNKAPESVGAVEGVDPSPQ